MNCSRRLARLAVPATRLGGQQGRGKGEGGGDGRAGPRLVAGAALTAVGVRVAEDQEEQRKSEKRFHPLDRLAALVSLQAEEPRKVQAARPAQFLDIEKEDKIRQFSPIDKLFDYFSSYQVVDEKGKKTTLMSARNFYNAMTPGSSIGQEFGKGRSSYMTIEETDLGADWLVSQNKVPREGLLNEMNEKGLLTYTDFHFLFLLMSTPRRYVDMVFHAFDVSADGNVESKEFVHILAKIANVKTNPEDLMDASKSGLVKYLFGDDLSGEVTRADFTELQNRLIDDVLTLEYTRYCPKEEKMSEVDFCRHMLYSANITNKKKERMIQRVTKKFGRARQQGISYESFRNFYNVLFGGADLERAMFFLDTEGRGVNREEFSKIAQWVAAMELDPHVVDVIYTLLDEDGDENLSAAEFNPVLFQWRHSRGFQKGSLAMSVGNLKF